ncbi:hypothetical protein BH10PSE2_BH10PSE2_11730 [soil metagenome]
MHLHPSKPSVVLAAGLCAILAGGLNACSKKAASPVEATAASDVMPSGPAASLGQATPSGQTALSDQSGLNAPIGGAVNGPGMDEPLTRASMLARSDARFDRMDVDHDGILSATELAAAVGDPAHDRGGRGQGGAGVARGPGGGARGFARADADGDGRITRAEARASATDRFARMDANGDGVIGEDERPQRRSRGGGN